MKSFFFQMKNQLKIKKVKASFFFQMKRKIVFLKKNIRSYKKGKASGEADMV